MSAASAVLPGLPRMASRNSNVSSARSVLAAPFQRAPLSGGGAAGGTSDAGGDGPGGSGRGRPPRLGLLINPAVHEANLAAMLSGGGGAGGGGGWGGWGASPFDAPAPPLPPSLRMQPQSAASAGEPQEARLAHGPDAEQVRSAQLRRAPGQGSSPLPSPLASSLAASSRARHAVCCTGGAPALPGRLEV